MEFFTTDYLNFEAELSSSSSSELYYEPPKILNNFDNRLFEKPAKYDDKLTKSNDSDSTDESSSINKSLCGSPENISKIREITADDFNALGYRLGTTEDNFNNYDSQDFSYESLDDSLSNKSEDKSDDESIELINNFPHSMKSKTSTENPAEIIISKLLKQLRAEDKWCDFSIFCGERKYRVHRCILFARTKHFDYLKKLKRKSATIDDCPEETMDAVIDIIYGASFPPANCRQEQFIDIVTVLSSLMVRGCINVNMDALLALLSPTMLPTVPAVAPDGEKYTKLDLVADFINAKIIVTEFDKYQVAAALGFNIIDKSARKNTKTANSAKKYIINFADIPPESFIQVCGEHIFNAPNKKVLAQQTALARQTALAAKTRGLCYIVSCADMRPTKIADNIYDIYKSADGFIGLYGEKLFKIKSIRDIAYQQLYEIDNHYKIIQIINVTNYLDNRPKQSTEKYKSVIWARITNDNYYLIKEKEINYDAGELIHSPNSKFLARNNYYTILVSAKHTNFIVSENHFVIVGFAIIGVIFTKDYIYGYTANKLYQFPPNIEPYSKVIKEISIICHSHWFDDGRDNALFATKRGLYYVPELNRKLRRIKISNLIATAILYTSIHYHAIIADGNVYIVRITGGKNTDFSVTPLNVCGDKLFTVDTHLFIADYKNSCGWFHNFSGYLLPISIAPQQIEKIGRKYIIRDQFDNVYFGRYLIPNHKNAIFELKSAKIRARKIVVCGNDAILLG